MKRVLRCRLVYVHYWPWLCRIATHEQLWSCTVSEWSNQTFARTSQWFVNRIVEWRSHKQAILCENTIIKNQFTSAKLPIRNNNSTLNQSNQWITADLMLMRLNKCEVDRGWTSFWYYLKALVQSVSLFKWFACSSTSQGQQWCVNNRTGYVTIAKPHPILWDVFQIGCECEGGRWVLINCVSSTQI